MKKHLLTYLLLINSLIALGQASEIAIAPTDNLQFGGSSLHHYGVGFFQYEGGYNLYGSGFFGVNFFTEGLNRLRIARNGNVGIGTTDPVSKLSVTGYSTGSDLYGRTSILLRNTNQIQGDGVATFNLASYWAEAGNVRSNFESRNDKGWVYGSVGTSTNHDFIVITNSTERIRFASNGNIGIGVNVPSAQLELADIYGSGGQNLRIGNDTYFSDIDQTNALGLYGLADSNIGNLKLGAAGPTLMGRRGELGIDYGLMIGNYGDKLGWDGTGTQPGYHIRFAGYRDVAGPITGAKISALRTNLCCNGLAQGMELAFFVSNGVADASIGDVNLKEAMRIGQNGNVGIGVTNPDHKLVVDGTIRAEEVKVEVITTSQMNVDGSVVANAIKVAANGQTADFVFDNQYKLRDLNEVATYVAENKHLPDVPSAADMEANGFDVAQMNKVLLQKVEELTLYLIAQQKEIELLKEKVNNPTK